MSVRYIDTHAHLSMLGHQPLEQILKAADEAGVGTMVTVSTDEESWTANQEIAEAHDNVYYTLGLHPHDSIRWPECAANLVFRFANNEVPHKCVAVGEIGLDFHYDKSPREMQLDVFESQLTLAKSLDLPVVIHCRDAFEPLFEIIDRVGLSSRPGVMHCFTGTTEEAAASVARGFYVSFSGIVTFKNSEALRETAKTVPLNRLVIETDCPFLAPVPMRGKPNEPSYLAHTALTIAHCLGITVEEVAEATTQNAIELFQLL